MQPDLHSLGSRLPRVPTSLPSPVSGGCIHDSYLWGDYFIKTNAPAHAETFAAEVRSLEAIADTGTIRTPEVISHGSTGEFSFLILEALDLRPSGDEGLLGEQLARLHQHTGVRYGFTDDNFIGSTPQPNPQERDWTIFFKDHRLGHLIRLLSAKGIRFDRVDALMERVPELLPAQPPPSLLHGDLWSGNKAFLADGTPVLFDPACYYGHASCDLAMTRLFGGFGSRFHDTYRRSIPDGYLCPELDDLYNLYHILNHALLFRGSYIQQAQSVIHRFS